MLVPGLCNQTSPDLHTNNITMNSIIVLLALVTLVVAQEAYAPAEYVERQERQADMSGENWLTRLISGNWWSWDR